MSKPETSVDEPQTRITVSYGFGYNTEQPFVQVDTTAQMAKMSPQHAREVAYLLWAAADAAESDGFLVTFLREKINVDDERAMASILNDFRKWRDLQRK